MPQKGAGFVCLSEVLGLIRYPIAAGVNIAAGDCLDDDGVGFAILGTDNITTTEFLGVAAEAVNNTGGAGDKYIQIIPPLENYRFYAPVENGQVDASNRGELVDLHSEDGIDITDDAVTTGWAFWIDKVEITNNYVYGYWRIAG